MVKQDSRRSNSGNVYYTRMLASQFTYRCSCFHCMRLPLQISYIPFDATFSSGIQPLGCRQRKEKNNSFFLLGKNGDMACVLLGACDSLAALRLELQAQDMYIMRQWKFVEPASRPAHSRSFLHFVAFCLFSDSLNYGWVCGCLCQPVGQPVECIQRYVNFIGCKLNTF